MLLRLLSFSAVCNLSSTRHRVLFISLFTVSFFLMEVPQTLSSHEHEPAFHCSAAAEGSAPNVHERHEGKHTCMCVSPIFFLVRVRVCIVLLG